MGKTLSRVFHEPILHVVNIRHALIDLTQKPRNGLFEFTFIPLEVDTSSWSGEARMDLTDFSIPTDENGCWENLYRCEFGQCLLCPKGI